MQRTMELLRDNCLGSKEVLFTITSNQHENFHDKCVPSRSARDLPRALRLSSHCSCARLSHAGDPCAPVSHARSTRRAERRHHTANYEDPNYNVALPVFSIHGNHDDPAGVRATRCPLRLFGCHATAISSPGGSSSIEVPSG